jgi:heat shock protein HslJ
MARWMKWSVATGLVLLLAAGCARPGTAGAGGLPSGHTFISTAVTDAGADRPLVDGTSITLRFDDDTITASAGCNTISGHAELHGDELVTGDLATTEIGCDQALADQDVWLAGFISGHPAVSVTGPILTMTGPSVVITLTDRKVVHPDKPLTGTHWVVDTILTGDAAGSVPQSVTADLTLGADGHASGSTGCRPYAADFTSTATRITFGPVTTGKNACTAETVDLDRAVLAVLTGTVAYHVDASRLTLTAASGAGIGLVAG